VELCEFLSYNNNKENFSFKLVGPFIRQEIEEIGKTMEYCCYSRGEKDSYIWGSVTNSKIRIIINRIKEISQKSKDKCIIQMTFYHFIEDLLTSTNYNSINLKKTFCGKFPSLKNAEKAEFENARRIFAKYSIKN